MNNSLCVRSLSPNDPGVSTAAYEFYVEFIEDLHEKGKEMPELDYSDAQEESEDIEADEVKITMYGNTVYINKHIIRKCKPPVWKHNGVNSMCRVRCHINGC